MSSFAGGRRINHGVSNSSHQKERNPLLYLLCVIISIIVVVVCSTLIDYNDYTPVRSSLLFLESEPVQHVQSVTTAGTLYKNDNNGTLKPILGKIPKATVAYAISLIKCGDFQSTSAGLTDAAIVLRHSVHLTSIRNPESGSNYDYKMYAIVHSDAEMCSQALTDAGFHIMIRPAPVQKSEIEDPYLRKHIHKEWCCGHDEFVKLYAYTILEHPIVVHVDIDFIFHKPMDDIFDTIIYDSQSIEGKAARERVQREFPFKPWPERVDCFMTRDWPQVIPGRIAAYQAGLLIIRPDMDAFHQILDVVRKTKYVEGFGRDNGWGGKGYGVFVGAMAMQGLIAYVYDEVLKDNWVELNQCRYNHMGMDTLYRKTFGFKPRHPKAGKCRNDLDYCEDCMNTNVTDIYNIHYTMCRKPWNCIGEGSSQGNFGKSSIPEETVHLDHCMKLISIWHSVRSDLENQLLALTSDDTVNDGRKGAYKRDFFHGHCTANGGSGYLTLSGQPETLKRLPELYKY